MWKQITGFLNIWMLSKVSQVIYFTTDFLLLGLKKKGGQQ